MGISRFEETIVGGDFRVTDVDLAVLRLLNRYRYLPSNYIGVLLEMQGKYYQDVLHKLRRKAGLIQCPTASWAAANARYRPAVYCLSPRGERLLQQRGLYVRQRKTGAAFTHELGVSMLDALFSIGARTHGLSLLSRETILQHPRCPKEARELADPWTISTTIDWPERGRNQRLLQAIRTDGEFFILARQHGKHRATLAFPGFEFDRRTEPLETENYERSSIKKKLLAFDQITAVGLYKAKLGLPNHVIAFITVNERHMQGMMRLAARLKHGDCFIFKTIQVLASLERFPEPNDDLVLTPWQRSDGSSISLLEVLAPHG